MIRLQVVAGAAIMSVTNISLSDILVGLLLLFSIYVLITKNGWKKGSIYLVGLLVIGSFLAIASIYFF